MQTADHLLASPPPASSSSSQPPPRRHQHRQVLSAVDRHGEGGGGGSPGLDEQGEWHESSLLVSASDSKAGVGARDHKSTNRYYFLLFLTLTRLLLSPLPLLLLLSLSVARSSRQRHHQSVVAGGKLIYNLEVKKKNSIIKFVIFEFQRPTAYFSVDVSTSSSREQQQQQQQQQQHEEEEGQQTLLVSMTEVGKPSLAGKGERGMEKGRKWRECSACVVCCCWLPWILIFNVSSGTFLRVFSSTVVTFAA